MNEPAPSRKPDPGDPSTGSGRVSEKNRNDLYKYRAEVAASKRKLQEDKKHEEWRGWRDIYAKNSETNVAGVDAIDVPITFANINVMGSTLTVGNPKFTVNPRNITSIMPAMIMEEVINYEWYYSGFQKQIRQAVQDMLIFGHGWVKLRYILNTSGKREDVPSLDTAVPADGSFNFPGGLENAGFDSDFDKAIESAKSVGGINPKFAAPLTDRKELARQVHQEGAIILEDRPVVERVSPFDMYVDPSATSLENAQWIAQRVPMRLDVAKKMEDWPARVRKQLSAGQKSLAEFDDGDAQSTPTDPTVTGAAGGSEMEWTVVWELYDLQENTWCRFDENADDFLVAPEPMPYIMGQPFRLIENYDVPDFFYPLGEVERTAPLQGELNGTRSALFNDIKQVKAKWAVDKDYLEDNSVEGLKHVLTSPDDNLIASIDFKNSQQRDLANIVQPIPSRTLNADLYNGAAAARNDMDDVTGVSEYQRGGGSTGAATATEAAIINDGALARLRSKQGRVETFMQESARGVLQLMLQFMSSRKTIRITLGAGGGDFKQNAETAGITIDGIEQMFTTYGRDDINGEFDLIVEVGSSLASNETQRIREADSRYAALVPLFGQGLINERAVLADYLRAHGVANVDRLLATPQPQQGLPGGTPYDPNQQGPGGVPTQGGGQLAPGGGIPQEDIGPPPL